MKSSKKLVYAQVLSEEFGRESYRMQFGGRGK